MIRRPTEDEIRRFLDSAYKLDNFAHSLGRDSLYSKTKGILLDQDKRVDPPVLRKNLALVRSSDRSKR